MYFHAAQTLLPAVIPMNLRERFEALNGKTGDDVFNHVLAMALDDQKQYVKLTQAEIDILLDPEKYPPNSRDTERLDEIRERLLEAMEITANLLKRRNITVNNARNPHK
jgi:hypothetical protein